MCNIIIKMTQLTASQWSARAIGVHVYFEYWPQEQEVPRTTCLWKCSTCVSVFLKILIIWKRTVKKQQHNSNSWSKGCGTQSYTLTHTHISHVHLMCTNTGGNNTGKAILLIFLSVCVVCDYIYFILLLMVCPQQHCLWNFSNMNCCYTNVSF